MFCLRFFDCFRCGIVILLCISPLVSPALIDSEDPIVNISTGSFRGVRVSDPDAWAFLGVPFAKPPVGRLRFRHPEPVDEWNGVYNATRLPNACWQLLDTSFGGFPGASMWNPTTNLSEDCLYLNVWIPIGTTNRSSSARDSGRAVMVWIHGGSFTSGSISRLMFDGKYLSAENDVIVVTIAYRLGALGFLYLNDSSAPGNQGLFDQLMALRWVQTNIGNFGGDKDRVTVFGCSAGGMSVILHVLSPSSVGLFRRAIVESGVFLSSTADATDARGRALRFAFDDLGCSTKTDDPRNVSACLRSIEPRVIVERQSGTFAPIVDGSFLTDTPEVLLTEGRFKKCPMIVGTVRNEGSYFVLYSFPEYLNLTYKTMNRDQFVGSMTRMIGSFRKDLASRPRVLNDVIAFYTNKDDPNDTDKNLESLDSAYTDIRFVCPTNDFARAYSSGPPSSNLQQSIYMYQLTQRYERSPWPEWLGVVHGDEMFFLFGSTPAPGLDLNPEERRLSRAIMTYWTNFAKTGNPNSPADGSSSSSRQTLGVWPEYKLDDRKYMDLNLRFLQNTTPSTTKELSLVENGIRAEECNALQKIFAESDDGPANGALSLQFIAFFYLFVGLGLTFHLTIVFCAQASDLRLNLITPLLQEDRPIA